MTKFVFDYESLLMIKKIFFNCLLLFMVNLRVYDQTGRDELNKELTRDGINKRTN